MMGVYTRLLKVPSRSFFLFGPRGTGKTTWLRQELRHAHWYDLLRDAEVVRLMRDPDTLTKEVQALPKGTTVVIDEVQRLPMVLNNVHDLISRFGDRYRFALTGSSARKIKRGEANLLAGRAVNRWFFPLTWKELDGSVAIEDLIRYGALPAVCSATEKEDKIDILNAYVENYIAQEIRLEAAVKQLEAFTRFLQVASLVNAQVVNVASLARDASVARPTVQGYFEVLTDTLLGTFLPPWQRKVRVKQVAHPKFYFFDTGVVRALGNRIEEPISSDERGQLFETLVLHELRAFGNVARLRGQLGYWRTPSGSEVDFVWSHASHAVGLEVKSSTIWRPEYSKVLKELVSTGTLTAGFGVYLGTRVLKDGPILVLPFENFIEKLYANEILRD